MDVPELTEDSICRLAQLLRKWRLDFLLPQFVEEKIDEEVLEMIDASHINILLHKYPMGVQIRFTHYLSNWRKSIGKPLRSIEFNEFEPYLNSKEIYEFCSRSQTSKNYEMSITNQESSMKSLSDNEDESTCTNDIHTIAVENASNANLSFETEVIKEIHSPTTSLQKPYSRPKLDLEEILINSPPNGPDLIQIYRKQKHFTHLDRKRLVGAIVNYYLECKLPMDLNTSYDLENAILIMFPNESLKMYRNSRHGKIFNRYNREKLKEKECEQQCSEKTMEDSGDIYEDETTTHIDHDILIQTIFEGQKKFTKIRSPFLYCSYLTTSCEMFGINKISDYCIFLNGYEVEEDRFKSLILKFYKSPTFSLELMPKKKSLDAKLISNHLPNVEYIRNMPTIQPLLKINERGEQLQNRHRTTLAKILIDECLKLNPERILKRPAFLMLAEAICKTFRNEVTSTYFIPCRNGKPARGKLWSAYINKRSLLCATGLVVRRRCQKRKLSADSRNHDDYEVHGVPNPTLESAEFSFNRNCDLKSLLHRWKETHDQRRQELMLNQLTPEEYMIKYSILQSEKGIHLVEVDVKQLYPVMGNIDNWLIFYHKVVDKTRSVRKYKHVTRIIEQIDGSMDTRYCASLALNLLAYMFSSFPRCSKPEIQNRFLKEFKSFEELSSDGEPEELQIRYIHQNQRIVYADFTIPGGYTFKFGDLLEALTHCFHYIMALNLKYPKICLCLWQFVQVAIFQIDIESGQLPQIESSINDLQFVDAKL
uniref:Uncharacterized protein n=1 Tax=Stomoxys calcitrans TaxID=35570 RepID=A0A1I8PQK1_STOCA